MEEKIKNLQQGVPKVDVTGKVMGKINKKDVRMKTPMALLAEKVGLQSVLVLVILGGALLIAMTLYILKKIGALSLLKLGMPGLKVILLSLPYDYIALLLIAVIVATYIVEKMDFSHGLKNYLDISAAGLLSITVLIGVFFAVMGVGEILKFWYGDRVVPAHEMSVVGRVMSLSGDEVTIKELDGNSEVIIFQKEKPFPYTAEYSIGKFLRAVGERDPQNPSYFRATDVSCCDAD